MTDDIPALIERARAWAGMVKGEYSDEGESLILDLCEALSSLAVSPLPASGATAAAAVCHDEQLEIWADEFVEHLLAADCEPKFGGYGEKIVYFTAVKNAIKDLVEKAFDHPELEKAAVSPLPEEIAGMTTFLRDAPFGEERFDAIAAALERMARENERLRYIDGGRQQALARVRELEAEVKRDREAFGRLTAAHHENVTKWRERISELEAERDGGNPPSPPEEKAASGIEKPLAETE